MHNYCIIFTHDLESAPYSTKLKLLPTISFYVTISKNTLIANNEGYLEFAFHCLHF
jgi:hypothetical protein